MDNLYPKGQYRPSMLGNNKGFILNPFHVNRDPIPGDPPGGDQPAPPAPPVVDPPAPPAPLAGDPPVSDKGWKGKLSADLRGSPMFQTYEDTPEGLNKAFESHANLQKLIGHEKVPIPKDANDKEGWARFNKAMGVPEKPEGYALQDIKVPDSLKSLMMDKNKFAQFMHTQNATPGQVQNAWKMYVQENVNTYNSHMDSLQKSLDATINVLKQEWGPAYDANIELGQSVITQFAEDKDTADFLTATLLKDAKGIKFMKKLGEQFAENKIGDFNIKRFALSPDEAKAELDQMMSNMEGPYFNQSKKFTAAEQDQAVNRANLLRDVIHKAKQGQA